MENKYIIELQKKIESDSLGVISVIGDRGFGKTTLLNNIKENSSTLNASVLDIIDPQLLPQDYSITTMILSMISKHIDGYANINKVREINKQVNVVIRNINLNLKISDNEQYGESYETITKINEKSDIKKRLNSIVDQVLCLTKNKYLISLVDDFDLLSPIKVESIVSEINSYIFDSKIKLIVGYKQKQLIEDLTELKLNDLSNQRKIHDDIVFQIAQQRALEQYKKSFVYDKHIYLDNINDFMEQEWGTIYCSICEDQSYDECKNSTKKTDCKETKSNLYPKINLYNYIGMVCEKNKIENVKEYTISDVYKQLLDSAFGSDLYSYYPHESDFSLYPTSPRDLIQKSEMFVNLIKDSKTNEGVYYKKILYYIEQIIQDNINDIELINIFLKFRDSKYEEKNYVLHSDLLQYLESKNIQNIDNYIIKYSGDVSVSDINDTLTLLSSNYQTLDQVRFVYLTKLYYSMLLKGLIYKIQESYKAYDDSNKNEINYRLALGESFTDYESLTRFNILSKHKKYYRLKNINTIILESFFDNLSFENNNEITHLQKLVFSSIYSPYNINSSMVKQNHRFFLENTEYSGEKDTITSLLKYTKYRDVIGMANNDITKTIIDFFNTPMDSENITGWRGEKEYHFDPMSLVLNPSYVYRVLQNKKISRGYGYLFYSLFDIDYINDYKTYRSSDSTPISRLYKRLEILIKRSSNILNNNQIDEEDITEIVDNKIINDESSYKLKKYYGEISLTILEIYKMDSFDIKMENEIEYISKEKSNDELIREICMFSFYSDTEDLKLTRQQLRLRNYRENLKLYEELKENAIEEIIANEFIEECEKEFKFKFIEEVSKYNTHIQLMNKFEKYYDGRLRNFPVTKAMRERIGNGNYVMKKIDEIYKKIGSVND